MKTKPYGSLEEVRKDLESKGLIGKHASEILSKHPALYHRVYSYGRRVGKTPNRLWADVGVLTSQELVSTHDELVDWAAKHKIIGKKLCDINEKHVSKLGRYANNTSTTLETVYKTLGIDAEYMIVYKTIADIRKDLESKGLVGKTSKDVINYDGHNTYSNIRSFARRQEIDVISLYGLVGIRYSDKTEISDGVVKPAMVYNSLDDIKRDLESKGLVGKTIRDVNQYDGSKTYHLIRTFARRDDVNVPDIWKKLGVLNSERIPSAEVPTFSSVKHIKSWLTHGGISLDLKEFRVRYKTAYMKILEFAVRKKMDRGVIWKEVGMKNGKEAINSIEEVISLLSKHSLRKATIKAIRNHGNGKVYKAIFNFTSRENIEMDMMWKTLGIKSERPSRRYRSNN